MAIFSKVVDCGAFSMAAKELGITTSAVSQHIRLLENELGIQLLLRSTRSLSLTEAGL
ncbi:MAG: LysR family transcriptional regulator, partial [Serratia proteamaculans]